MLRGMNVTVAGRAASVLPTVDDSLGDLVEKELTRHGVSVSTGVSVEEIRRNGEKLLVAGTGGFTQEADVVLIGAGVRPSTNLATDAGIATGERGAIRVDRRMRTNLDDVYAAGDCAETFHALLARNVYLPLGTMAHKQGRIAGENAVGGHRVFAGSFGT